MSSDFQKTNGTNCISIVFGSQLKWIVLQECDFWSEYGIILTSFLLQLMQFLLNGLLSMDGYEESHWNRHQCWHPKPNTRYTTECYKNVITAARFLEVAEKKNTYLHMAVFANGILVVVVAIRYFSQFRSSAGVYCWLYAHFYAELTEILLLKQKYLHCSNNLCMRLIAIECICYENENENAFHWRCLNKTRPGY